MITASLPALKNLSGRAIKASVSSFTRSGMRSQSRSHRLPDTGASVSTKSGQSSESVSKVEEYTMQSKADIDGEKAGIEVVKTRTIRVDVEQA